MLGLLLGMCAVAARDALNDRTPRKPWVWTRPQLEWWAARRTRRELARVAISLPAERTAQEVTTSVPLPSDAAVHPAPPVQGEAA
jgi:hypothetical protein